MIGKGKAIAHTQASVAYGWNQEKGAEVVFKQELVGDSPAEITQEFKMVQDQNYHCQKNTNIEIQHQHLGLWLEFHFLEPSK